MKLTGCSKAILSLVLILTWAGCPTPGTSAPAHLQWLYVNIRALPQTIEVQTHRGSYLAVFQMEARVYPTGAATGFMDLTQADGTEHRFQIIAGRAQVHANGGAGRIGGIAVDPTDPSGNAFVFNIRPAPASEPCRIYDIAGTQVHARFEAETQIDVITN